MYISEEATLLHISCNPYNKPFKVPPAYFGNILSGYCSHTVHLKSLFSPHRKGALSRHAHQRHQTSWSRSKSGRMEPFHILYFNITWLRTYHENIIFIVPLYTTGKNEIVFGKLSLHIERFIMLVANEKRGVLTGIKTLVFYHQSACQVDFRWYILAHDKKGDMQENLNYNGTDIWCCVLMRLLVIRSENSLSPG